MSPIPRRPGARAFAVRSFLFAIGFAALACAPDPSASRDTTRERGVRPAEAPLVLVAPVVAREMVQSLVTTAVVESEVEITVVPRTAGEVVEVLAEEGERVDVGAVLARLERREQELARDEAEIALRDARTAAERARVAVAEARSRTATATSALAQAERDHERDRSLATGGDGRFASVSAKAVEASALALDRARQEHAQAELAVERSEIEERAARTAIERAEVVLARAEVALADRDIRAPFPGRVARREVRVGQQAGPASPAFVLTDLDALRVVFHRPQRELATFLAAAGPSRGTLALTATCDAWPGARFAGRIERVSPTIDPASGSFRVTARLSPTAIEGEGARLVPGLLVRLTLVTDRRADALTVPKRAVQREGNAAFLLVVEDGILRKVQIVEGYTDDECVEVRALEGAALVAGADVVTVGSRDLDHGSPVRITRAPGAPPEPAPEPDAGTGS